MKCEKWSCRSVRHDRTPARPVTVTKMQRSRPAGKPDFSAMGCPCVWRNLSEQRCSARCVSGMFRKVDGGRCRCWWRRVANRFAGSSFGDVSRSGAERDDRETQKARPEYSGRAFCVSLSSRSAPLRETSPKEDPAKRFATLRHQHRHLPPSTLRNIPETHLAEHRCSERFRHTQGHPIAEKSGLPAGRLRCIFVTVTGRAGVRSCRTERHDHFSHFITPDTQARYKLPSPPYRCNIFVTQT